VAAPQYPSGVADAAVVLGAAVWNEEPSPVFDQRISHAINLYFAHRVDYLIFTGGVGRNDRLAEADVGRQRATDAGIPANNILVDTDSVTTCENLVNALELAAQNEILTFVIVTDPLHTRRSITIATDLGMAAYPSPTPTSRYTTWRSQVPFLARETYFLLSYMVRHTLLGNAARC
jgi:uncharacterized SAM-binding protein YcdF (DUF218 family)